MSTNRPFLTLDKSRIQALLRDNPLSFSTKYTPFSSKLSQRKEFMKFLTSFTESASSDESRELYEFVRKLDVALASEQSTSESKNYKPLLRSLKKLIGEDVFKVVHTLKESKLFTPSQFTSAMDNILSQREQYEAKYKTVDKVLSQRYEKLLDEKSSLMISEEKNLQLYSSKKDLLSKFQRDGCNEIFETASTENNTRNETIATLQKKLNELTRDVDYLST